LERLAFGILKPEEKKKEATSKGRPEKGKTTRVKEEGKGENRT